MSRHISQEFAPWVYAAALAGLPLQTHRRLRQLIHAGDPGEVWARLQSKEVVLSHLPRNVNVAWWQAAQCNLAEIYDTCQRHNIQVVVRGTTQYPSVLMGDPHSPAVLFVRGDITCVQQRRVGIIGTRHATAHGSRMAFRLGAQLGQAGVSVVSGLARGIDVQAHAGILSLDDMNGRPIAVVASGVDYVYPPEHKDIWNRICNEGVVISESPPGAAPLAHRFPLRNRIIAALSEVLVVVESGHRGGSMITVREALQRDVAVMAVPGSPHFPQSDGTTALLRDGCAPVGDVTDVLVALGLDTRRAHTWCDHRELPSQEELRLLDVMGKQPHSVDSLSLQSSQSVIDTAILLGRLQAKGWVAHSDGWWEALID